MQQGWCSATTVPQPTPRAHTSARCAPDLQQMAGKAARAFYNRTTPRQPFDSAGDRPPHGAPARVTPPTAPLSPAALRPGDLNTAATSPLPTRPAAGPLAPASIPPSPPPRIPGRGSALTGIALTVTACAFFCLLDTGSKYVGAALPLLMALWLRYALQSLFTVGYGMARHGGEIFHTTRPRFQLMRAALFCSSNVCAMMSLRYLPLAEFTAIVAMTPLAMTLVAALWLRQPVSPLRWVLVAVGFIGTMVIIRPGGANFSGGALLWPGLQLAANTAYQIVSSQMAGRERPLTTQIYTSLLALVLTTATLPWFWQWPSTWGLWLGALAMGVGSSIGHMMLLKAYEHARPATISPFLYSQIPFALFAGWLMYGHMPDHWAVLGMVAIAVGGALSAWLSVRESR
jgi:drug/metabolite transporter (DMT)-like permease